MKVLSIEQMNRLKELGVDNSIASMAIYDIYAGENKVYDIIASNGAFPEEQEYDRFGYGIYSAVAFCKKPVFTLQDIIELLPETLPHQFLYPTLRINKTSVEYVDYSYFKNVFIENSEYDEKEDILNAAYNMLIWVIKNGYLTKTKK